MRLGYQVFLTGFFLLMIFTVPVTQAIIEIRHGQLPGVTEFFSRAPTHENLRAFENGLEDASWFARRSRPWMQYFWFRALRNLGEKAILGQDGWLFYKPDVRYLVEPCLSKGDKPMAEDDPFSAIVGFRDELAWRGIHLMVIPMPGKPSIYPDKLTRRAAATDRTFPSHTLDLIARLREADVEVVDLFQAFWKLRAGKQSPLEEPYYLPQDTHWSGMAVRLAASVVAERIRELGWVDVGTTEYDLKPVSVKRRGDIVRMASVPQIEREFPVEEVKCYQVVQKANGEPYEDDAHSPVLLLGDSFMRIYQTDEPFSAGFIAHLARELQEPLNTLINDGGASTLVRQELTRRFGLLQGKKVVIWEFVERDIRFGTEGWKYVPMPEDFKN